MFYPERIVSIGPEDKVLEIGPGASPHPRSNAFLELAFESDEEKVAQRGGGTVDGVFGKRPVFYYDGGKFPFGDGEFDYVICSHVVEHVDNPAEFLGEVFRVGGGRGYIEYPMIPYEYMYSFDVHKNFVKYKAELGTLLFMRKTQHQFQDYIAVHNLFYRMLELGWDDLCVSNKEVFFEGFEYREKFGVLETDSIADLCPAIVRIKPKSTLRRLILGVMNRLKI